MKAHTKKKPLLIVAFVMFSLLLFFRFVLAINEKSIPKNTVVTRTSPTPPGLPVRLTIPIINVDANIQYIGITESGNMDVPSNTADVGWFKLGPRPGEIGSAVIAGHFDGKNGEPSVFFNLYKLKKGDKLYIENDKGKTTTFIIQESHTYDPGYAEKVFSSNDSAHLNLITCDGVWNGAKKSYTKRLVVFANVAN